MPRPPRYNEAGIYHIINRGVERRDIFLENSDYDQFMAILGDLTTKYGVKKVSGTFSNILRLKKVSGTFSNILRLT